MTTLTVKIPEGKTNDVSIYIKKIGGEIVTPKKTNIEIDEDDEVKEEGDGEERGKIFCRNAGNVRGQCHRSSDGEETAGNDVLDDEQEDESDGCRDEIAGRTRERDEDVIAAIVLEVAGGHWGGFGPADERPVIEQGDQRHDDGAEQIEVLEWVQSYTA